MAHPPPVNDYERRVVANVGKYGWHCTSVSRGPGDAGAGFAYTVGLFHSYRQPEFIIFGLDAEIAYAILGICADAAAAGEMYALDKPCNALVEGYECVFVEVPRARFNDFVCSASWFYAGHDFPLYQVVWPDRKGRYPWNGGAKPDPWHKQPVLALERVRPDDRIARRHHCGLASPGKSRVVPYSPRGKRFEPSSVSRFM